MSKMLNIVTISIVFLKKKNAPTHDIESWGFGEYIRNIETIDPDDIFGGETYEKEGDFNLNHFLHFKHKFIYYTGETTF